MTKDELVKLAERCEAASGPDRSFDAEIHLALFGGKTSKELALHESSWGMQFYTCPDTGHEMTAPFRFTGSVDDAERVLPGPEWPEWQITRRYCTGYHANVGLGEDSIGCNTPALALCAASLRARATTAGEAK